jgi:hypothetical protein
MKNLYSIGVFWIYKSQIYFKSIITDDVKAINGFKDSDFAHYQVWNELSSQNKDFYLYEYEDIPRGRVIYDIKSSQFIVYSNYDIINSDEAKALIIKGFNLRVDNVLFKNDDHYKIINSV